MTINIQCNITYQSAYLSRYGCQWYFPHAMHTYNYNSQYYCAPLLRFGWSGSIGVARGTTKKMIIITLSE